jgi:IclR family KDG regulon transcriptional repressor
MTGSNRPKEEHSGVGTLDNVVRILECFSPERPYWSLADLTGHLDMPKSSLHRYLLALQHHGVLRRDQDKIWHLGFRLFLWGNMVSELSSLRHLVKPYLFQLVDSTNESAFLTIYEQQEVICIDKVESNQAVRLTLAVGKHRMPHAGAASKILMAYLPEEEIQSIIRDQGLPKICKNTITDPAELQAELARIRENGFAFSMEESDEGAWGLATPIIDGQGNTRGAISIAAPISRYSEPQRERCIELCRFASEEIKKILRGETPTRSASRGRAGIPIHSY